MYCGSMPSKILTFARPVSASNRHTLLPRVARAMARFTDVVVLPTPPLPLVIVMTLAVLLYAEVSIRHLLNHFLGKE